MDKIDEWMNRAFDSQEPERKDNSNSEKQQQAPRGQVPNKGQFNHNNKTVNNIQKQGTFSVHVPNKQQTKMESQNRNSQQSRPAQQNARPQHGSQPQHGFQPQRGPHQQQNRAPQHNAPAQHSGQPQQNKAQIANQPRPQAPRAQQPSRAQHQGKPAHGGHQGHHFSQPSKSGHKAMPKAPKSNKAKNTIILKNKVKIIPLGGLNEVGKNMMAFEYEDDIMIIDMGLEFPGEDLFGIDYVIPDITYLEDNKKRIRGIVITHGHLDHIGGIPYMLPKLDYPPIFATKLTIGLIKKRIDEFKQEKLARLNVINPDQPLKLGQFLCNFFRVAHSIPDCVGVVIDTPIGKLVHTGDFKFDETPARNQAMADIHKMEALGNQNVLALFCESTNSMKPGHSLSEQEVGITLERIISEASERVIIASFSSQVGRIQQILDAAVKCRRKVFVSGRSMNDTMNIAASLGYLSFPKDLVFDIKKYKKIPDRETLILTTGSQGESVSALARIATNEHPHVRVQKGDTIVLSSSPIIGNERAISTVVNKLSMMGAEVIQNQIADVHTSGHGKQDELVRMINYVKPKYLIPVHGEYFMRKELCRIAKDRCNLDDEHMIMLQNGDVMIAEPGKVYNSGEVVDTKYVLIDGLGEGNFDSQVQMDREVMSQNGALVVLVYIDSKAKKIRRAADVVSRGFIYMHEAEAISNEISRLAGEAYSRIMQKNAGANRQDIKKYIRQTIDKYTHSTIERRPLIIPLIVES